MLEALRRVASPHVSVIISDMLLAGEQTLAFRSSSGLISTSP